MAQSTLEQAKAMIDETERVLDVQVAMGVATDSSWCEPRVRKALYAAQQACAEFTRAGDAEGRVSALEVVVQCNFALNDLSAALRAASYGLAMLKKTGERRATSRAMDLLQSVQSANGDPQGALETAEEWLCLQRELGDLPGEAKALRVVASLKLDAGTNNEVVPAVATAEALGAVEELERCIKTPKGASMCCDTSGTVGILELLNEFPGLADVFGGLSTPSELVAKLAQAVVLGPPGCPLVLGTVMGATGPAVRLRSPSERACHAKERHALEMMVGYSVEVLVDLRSKSIPSVMLMQGFKGVVEKVDANWDALIKFSSLDAKQWVCETDFAKLRLLRPQVDRFFLKGYEPFDLKMQKVVMMVRLCTKDNFEQVLLEFKKYAVSSDADVADVVTEAIRWIRSTQWLRK